MKIKILIVFFAIFFIVLSFIHKIYPGLLVYHLNSQPCFATVCAKSKLFIIPIFEDDNSGCLWYFKDKMHCYFVYDENSYIGEYLDGESVESSFGNNKYDVYSIKFKNTFGEEVGRMYYKLRGFPVVIEVNNNDEIIDEIFSVEFYYK